MTAERKCCYCGGGEGKPEDLRPYGPNGAYVCFDCAFSTPERKAETEARFRAQLEACGPVSVIGGNDGPVPLIKEGLQ